MSRKLLTLILALLAASLILAGCDSGAVEEAVNEIAPTLEAAANEIAPTLEAAVEEIAPTLEAAATEMAPTLEAAATEVIEAVEEMMDEGPCAPATEGPLAGVDPRGLTIEWWHNHTGSREKQLQVLVSEFNNTNECIELDENGEPVLLPADTDRVLYSFVLDAEGNRAEDADGNLLLEETSSPPPWSSATRMIKPSTS
jgi:outer membrane murein-binding lipoprotein Lpp